MEQRFDRAEEDLGNIVGLEHVNVLIPISRSRRCSTSPGSG